MVCTFILLKNHSLSEDHQSNAALCSVALFLSAFYHIRLTLYSLSEIWSPCKPIFLDFPLQFLRDVSIGYVVFVLSLFIFNRHVTCRSRLKRKSLENCLFFKETITTIYIMKFKTIQLYIEKYFVSVVL